MAFIPLNDLDDISKDLTLASLSNVQGEEILFEDSVVLEPGMYRMSYNRHTDLRDSQLGIMDGKSSLARLGFCVAKRFFQGTDQDPLYVTTLLPIKIYKNMPIAQIVVDDKGVSGEEEMLGSISISSDNRNLTLGNKIYKYTLKDGEYLDPKSDDNNKYLAEIIIDKNGLALDPFTLYLALTNEKVAVRNCVAMLTTPGMRSSGDMTLFSIEHAALIKDGWVGNLALEITSYAPGTVIYPNMNIGTLTSLGNTSKKCRREESGYKGQVTPAPRKMV